jgi:hypothetical protein
MSVHELICHVQCAISKMCGSSLKPCPCDLASCECSFSSSVFKGKPPVHSFHFDLRAMRQFKDLDYYEQERIAYEAAEKLAILGYSALQHNTTVVISQNKAIVMQTEK